MQLALLLMVLAAPAAAASITIIPGDYTITGGNWDSGGPTVVGRNNATGNPFAVVGSNYYEFSADSLGLFDLGFAGVTNGFIVANVIDGGFNSYGVTLSTTGGIVNTFVNYEFGAVGSGGAVGGTSVFGNPFIGSLNGAGELANIQLIPTTGSGVTQGVAGLLSAGGSGSTAFVADGATLRSIDSGVDARGIGVDPITNSAFGYRNGEAVEWLPDGTMLWFNDPETGTPIRGKVTTGWDGLRTIQANNGALFVSDGITVMTFGDYMMRLYGQSVITTSAFFSGDPNSLEMALIFANSVEVIRADRGFFQAPFGGGTQPIPEPVTVMLVGSAAGLLLALKIRRQ
jgi:hypothetical protein